MATPRPPQCDTLYIVRLAEPLPTGGHVAYIRCAGDARGHALDEALVRHNACGECLNAADRQGQKVTWGVVQVPA